MVEPPADDGSHHDGHNHSQPYFFYPYCTTCAIQQQPATPAPGTQVNWLYIGVAILIGGIIGYAISNSK